MQRWHPCDLLSHNMCNTLVFTLYCYFEKSSRRCKVFMWRVVQIPFLTAQLVKLEVMAVVFFISSRIESIKQHCGCPYISGGCQMTLLRQFQRKNKAKLIWGSGPRSIKLPPLFAFLYQKLEPSAWMKRIRCTHIWRKAAKNTREGEKKIALFISPSLSFSFPHSPQGSIRK